MKTINTIDDAIKMLREPIPYMEPDEDLMQTADWLEELKTLRVEHEKNSKELEVYKKALGLACEHWSDLEEVMEECGIEIKYHIYSPLPRDKKVEVYLKKAREEV